MAHGGTVDMDDRTRALGELQAIAKEFEEEERRLADLRTRRDGLIRAAVAVGVPRRQIALAANVNRGTVYAAAPVD
jgi:hypothetical protein